MEIYKIGMCKIVALVKNYINCLFSPNFIAELCYAVIIFHLSFYCLSLSFPFVLLFLPGIGFNIRIMYHVLPGCSISILGRKPVNLFQQ